MQRPCVCVCLCSVTQSCLTLCDPVDCSPHAPLSMGSPRQEYWSGLPWPSPGDLPNPGIEPVSLVTPALAGRLFTACATWEAHAMILFSNKIMVWGTGIGLQHMNIEGTQFNPNLGLRCGKHSIIFSSELQLKKESSNFRVRNKLMKQALLLLSLQPLCNCSFLWSLPGMSTKGRICFIYFFLSLSFYDCRVGEEKKLRKESPRIINDCLKHLNSLLASVVLTNN